MILADGLDGRAWMMVLREAITREECFSLIGPEASKILRNGLKDKSLGRTTLASAAGVVLTASPLLIQYETIGLHGREALAIRHAFSDAMETWSRATEGRLVFREHGDQEANVVVRVYDEYSRNAPSGMAHACYGRQITVKPCGSIALHVESSISISKQFIEGQMMNPSRLSRVCLHELGHIAGLADGPPGGVMCPLAHPREAYPSETERLAIKVIMGAAAYLQHHESAESGTHVIGGQWPCRGFLVESRPDRLAA